MENKSKESKKKNKNDLRIKNDYIYDYKKDIYGIKIKLKFNIMINFVEFLI